MHETLTIRKAELKDAEELLSIYAPYVEKTAVTFEYEVPSLEEFQNRMKGIMERYPYLVAEKEGRIIGYAYTCRFHPRDAYQWCAETAIYLEMDQRHHGAGRALYRRLEDISVLQGIRNLNACIAYPEGEDPYLDLGSPLFHEKMGYHKAAHFHRCGYKFGRWYDMIWMEKEIGTGEEPSPVIPFSAIGFPAETVELQ